MDLGQPLSEKRASELSALTLAYVGDAVQTLFVRQKLVEQHDCKPDLLHKLASDEVKAEAQARLAEKLYEVFTKTELSVYLRGRNSSSHHRAKNQSSADYRKATGLEAVFGYLYLTGQTDRLSELLGTEI